MKILIIQNRMGIGDMIIFLPFIEAISKKFNSPVSLLVKESSKADQYLNYNKYVKVNEFLPKYNGQKTSSDLQRYKKNFLSLKKAVFLVGNKNQMKYRRKLKVLTFLAYIMTILEVKKLYYSKLE